jgi:hypothetical protein
MSRDSKHSFGPRATIAASPASQGAPCRTNARKNGFQMSRAMLTASNLSGARCFQLVSHDRLNFSWLRTSPFWHE